MDGSEFFSPAGHDTVPTAYGRRESTSYSTSGDSTVNGSGPYQIIVNPVNNIQVAEPPKYQILEHVDNEEQFYNWLYKNRKETLLAPVQYRRPLTELMTKECKEDISQIIVKSNVKDADLFEPGAPYPRRGWCDVTEKLALRVLFKMNGPKSATDAKKRLKKIVPHFNDSTQEQKFFTSKIKKHNRQFCQQLEDFAHCARLWPEHDKKLTHLMIIDAYSDNFSSTETIVGPDGITRVPKCSNFQIIRDKIRDNKGSTLEEIQTVIIDHFERIDDGVRAAASENLGYRIVPWKKPNEKKFKSASGNGSKRLYSQHEAKSGGAHAGGGAAAQTAKKFRPPPKFDRCNNCGSIGHECGERTCYTFGHPKGKGPNGTWADGEPSLNLVPKEWKDWRAVRHAIFYAYPENAHLLKNPA